jgi:hypothetical protein
MCGHKFETMSLPLAFSPSNLVYFSSNFTSSDDDEFISLNELESNDDIITIDSVLIAMVMYYKMSDQNNKISVYTRAKNQEYHSYSRMITLMCLNSSPGRNCFSILVGKQRNNSLFDSFLQGRDSGLFQPGAIVCIHRPQCVGNWLGGASGAGHPLLDMPGSFQLVDRSKCIGNNVLLEVKATDGSERLHGFYYPAATLELLNVHFINSNCGGNLCGSLGMYSSDGQCAPTCACFHAIQRTGNILMMVTIKVTAGGKAFIVKNFTSRPFTNLFLKNGVPTGLTATSLNENIEYVRSYIRNIKRAFRCVNEADKFWVAGWLRKGFMNDDGLTSSQDGSVGSASVSSKVKSSEVTYHITSVGFNGDDVDIVKSDLSEALDVKRNDVGGGVADA